MSFISCKLSPMRFSDMLDLNHGFPCFIIAVHQGQLWLSTCAARRIYSSKSGSNGEHGFQGRLPTGWNEKTPEGLNAWWNPWEPFSPWVNGDGENHWKPKNHHFPDSIQIQLWGCKLLVEHPGIPIVSSLKVCKKLIKKVDPRWFQRFYIFTRILGVSWSNLTFIFFKWVGSTTN